MSKFNPNLFFQFILDNKVVGFFDRPITLKSGRMSHWYVNWRNISSDVYLLGKLSDFLISFVAELGLKPDCFYGVPEGATKLALISTYKLASSSKEFAAGSHVLAMGRGQIKEHGDPKDRFFLGEPKGNIVVVEDVTTTGGSLLVELEKLKKINVTVMATIGLTNRLEKRDDGQLIGEKILSYGVPYYSMSDANSLLPAAIDKFNPPREIVSALKKERDKFGAKP